MDKDVLNIYNGILLGNENEILPLAITWMELECVMLSEVREGDISLMWNLRYFFPSPMFVCFVRQKQGGKPSGT